MSYKDMRIVDLREVAESFAVDLEGAKSKNQIIKALEEQGVTYEFYDRFKNADRVKPEDDTLSVFQSKSEKEDISGEAILVKMDRSNAFYQVGRYTFTSDHPFVSMPVDDAQEIFDNEEGFRVATPGEVKQYYS